MADPTGPVRDVLNSFTSGGLFTFFGALAGRAMWHSNEVRAKRRKLFGRELLWDTPVLIGMWMVGLGVGDYWQLSLHSTAAVCSVLSYLGPRGVEVAVERWMEGRSDK